MAVNAVRHAGWQPTRVKNQVLLRDPEYRHLGHGDATMRFPSANEIRFFKQ